MKILLGISGASGAVYGVRAGAAFLAAGVELHLLVTKIAWEIMAGELPGPPPPRTFPARKQWIARLLPAAPGKCRLYSEDDVRRVEQIKRLQQLLGFTLADIKEMVEAEEVKLQLRAEYRPEAEASERRAKIAKAIEVTERQVAVIDQKLKALDDMKTLLEQRLARYHGWLEHVDDQAAATHTV